MRTLLYQIVNHRIVAQLGWQNSDIKQNGMTFFKILTLTSKDVKSLYYKVVTSSYHHIFYTMYTKNISLHCVSSVEHLLVFIKPQESELKKIFRKIV